MLDEKFPSGAVTRLHGLLSEVPHLAETRDCLRLTDRILRMIQDEMDQAREQARQPGDSDPESTSDTEGRSTEAENHTPSDEDKIPKGNGPRADVNQANDAETDTDMQVADPNSGHSPSRSLNLLITRSRFAWNPHGTHILWLLVYQQ